MLEEDTHQRNSLGTQQKSNQLSLGEVVRKATIEGENQLLKDDEAGSGNKYGADRETNTRAQKHKNIWHRVKLQIVPCGGGPMSPIQKRSQRETVGDKP